MEKGRYCCENMVDSEPLERRVAPCDGGFRSWPPQREA